jgi:hypothetical protein
MRVSIYITHNARDVLTLILTTSRESDSRQMNPKSGFYLQSNRIKTIANISQPLNKVYPKLPTSRYYWTFPEE